MAQASSISHHLAFYDASRAGIRQATPYANPEQVRDALVPAGADVDVQPLTYQTGPDERPIAQGLWNLAEFVPERLPGELVDTPLNPVVGRN